MEHEGGGAALSSVLGYSDTWLNRLPIVYADAPAPTG